MAKKVAVIDDSEIVLTMASAALESSGYEVLTATVWEEMDRMLQGVTPDLVLLDVNMPEIFGDHALMFFREERSLESVPILLYSDIDVEELAQRAKDCEADGYISKGWGVERMVEVVDGYLKKPA